MAKNKVKTNRDKKVLAPAQSDDAVVFSCMKYAGCVGAFKAAYDVCPDPNSKFAEAVVGRIETQAATALAAANIPVTTSAAIRAKAAAAEVLINQYGDELRTGMVQLSHGEVDFLRTFTADVHKCLGKVLDAEWSAANAAKQGGAA